MNKFISEMTAHILGSPLDDSRLDKLAVIWGQESTVLRGDDSPLFGAALAALHAVLKPGSKTLIVTGRVSEYICAVDSHCRTSPVLQVLRPYADQANSIRLGNSRIDVCRLKNARGHHPDLLICDGCGYGVHPNIDEMLPAVHGKYVLILE